MRINAAIQYLNVFLSSQGDPMSDFYHSINHAIWLPSVAHVLNLSFGITCRQSVN